MGKVGDADIFRRIHARIKGARIILERLGYESQPISSREFHDYMTGDTPTCDPITTYDVLDKACLIVHEFVEISELKKMSVPIDREPVTVSCPKVYEAHIAAMN